MKCINGYNLTLCNEEFASKPEGANVERTRPGCNGMVVVKICQMWDVNSSTGRYLSTDFIVSDRKPADVVGYVTNVGRTTQQKSGSKNLDFHLANNRVTLWGRLNDMLIEKRTRHVGLYPIVLIAMSMKLYNSKIHRLYISSTSSTLIVDDEQIPMLKRLKTDNSGMGLTKEMQPPDNSETKAGTLENLLMLELEISDATAEAVVVMFDETAKRRGGLEFATRDGKHCGYKPHFGAQVLHVRVCRGVGCGVVRDCKELVVEVAEKGEKGINSTFELVYRGDSIKDFDAEESFVVDSKAKGGDMGCASDTRKRKRPRKQTTGLKGKAIADTPNPFISKPIRRTTDNEFSKNDQGLRFLAIDLVLHPMNVTVVMLPCGMKNEITREIGIQTQHSYYAANK
nr:hypothetical protein [Tanacetum cinerariifolium]